MRAKGRSTIRFLSDGLVDEAGNAWDRVRGERYDLTSEELDRLAPVAVRYLVTHGYGSSATEVDADEFARLANAAAAPRITGYRRSVTGAIWVLDDSDC